MTHLVADILGELREDHRNMALMLNLLESEGSRIHDGEEPDFELLHDILSYMTVYSDAVHHPKENLIYGKLWSRGPDLSSGLERVEDDHREIASLGQVLRRDFEAIVAGAAVTRDRVISDTFAYAEHLRSHMLWEEDDLFRRADKLVEESATVTIDASHLDTDDPVFGDEPVALFDNLLRSIQDAAAQRNVKPT
jgi:hemerythrin-like domain-containing protein